MANPYHDELGRFCSAGEMEASFTRLFKEGRLEEAAELKREYESIGVVRAAEKALHKLAPEQSAAAASKAAAIVERLSRRSGWEESAPDLDHQFNSSTDEEVEAVGSALLVQEDSFLNHELKEEEDKAATARGELHSLSGYDSFDKLNSDFYSVTREAKEEGQNLLGAIRAEASKNGLKYPADYFGTLAARLGIGDDHYHAYGVEKASAVVKPFDEKTLKSKAKDAERRAIIQAAMDKVVTDRATEVEAYNQKVARAAELGVLKNKFGNMIYNTDLSRARSKAAGYESAHAVVADQVAWRKEVRAAGVKSKALKVTNVGGLKSSKLSVDDNGAVNNAWVLKKTPGDPSTRTLVRVVGVSARTNPYEPDSLVGEDGNKYSAFTHYANYKSSTRDFSLIVDDTIGGNHPHEGLRFHASIDSGD